MALALHLADTRTLAVHPYIDNRVRNKLRLRHLELLDVLGEGLNVHAAASRLSLTQPAVTKMLQDVEEIYRAQLFDRHSRGLRPTRAGESAIRWARQVLHNIGESVAEAHMITAGAVGTLRVGTLAVAIPTLLSGALTKLAATSPNVVFSVVESGIQSLLPALARNELDIVLGRLSTYAQQPPFASERLYDEATLYIVVRKEHPLALKHDLRVADLADARWILPPEPAPIRHEIAKLLRSAGLPFRNATMESTSLLLMELLLGSTDLIAPLPTQVAQHFRQTRDFTILPLEVPIQMPSVGMVWNADSPVSPVLAGFMDALRESARTLNSSHADPAG